MTGDVPLVLAGVTRLTQILLHDDVARVPRTRIIRASNARRDLKQATGNPDAFAYAAKLWTCPWCMSVWVASAVFAGLKVAPGATRLVLRVTATSLVASVTDLCIDALESKVAPVLDTPPVEGPPPVDLAFYVGDDA